MRVLPDHILDEATTWHLAAAGDDMDWDGFTAWLEADTLHREAYDQVALADDVAERHGPALAAEFAEAPDQPDRRAARGRWPLWGGAAIAASLVALFVVPQLVTPTALTYATAEQSQTVALEDGSRVVVAPHSTLTVAGREQDELTLAGGAYFDIRHDPGRSLVVHAGALEVTDIGTRFDIQTGNAGARVKVAEGQVRVRGEALGTPVDLSAGKSLRIDLGSRRATITNVAPEDVGNWRAGRLTFDSAPLALVASDLARYAGLDVDVPPALANRRFSGTLLIGDGETAVRDLAQIMGLNVVRSGGRYRLDPAG